MKNIKTILPILVILLLCSCSGLVLGPGDEDDPAVPKTEPPPKPDPLGDLAIGKITITDAYNRPVTQMKVGIRYYFWVSWTVDYPAFIDRGYTVSMGCYDQASHSGQDTTVWTPGARYPGDYIPDSALQLGYSFSVGRGRWDHYNYITFDFPGQDTVVYYLDRYGEVDEWSEDNNTARIVFVVE